MEFVRSAGLRYPCSTIGGQASRSESYHYRQSQGEIRGFHVFVPMFGMVQKPQCEVHIKDGPPLQIWFLASIAAGFIFRYLPLSHGTLSQL